MEKVTMFKASNGKVLETTEEVEREELALNIQKVIDDELCYGYELNCGSRHLAERVVESLQRTTKLTR